jgi:hypothetical protein
MKVIKFTELELESMIEMYTAEMEEAMLYISKIQDILEKLGAQPATGTVVEKDPKKGKIRGPKPSVKAGEIKERKKPGRKPKSAAIPEVKTVAGPTKPVKKEKAARVKAEKKPFAKPLPKKKTAAAAVPEPTAKSVPVAANKANTKASKPKKEKVARVKSAKPVKKAGKTAATVESAVASLLTTAPEKEIAKVAKKKAPKKRTKGFVRLAPLGKPLTKKTVVAELAPAEKDAFPGDH